MAWPTLRYADWAETCSALHMYSQVVGKYRIANTPWLNHSWHATLYVNSRGLTTGLVPDGAGVEVSFDLIDHVLIVSSPSGKSAGLDLRPMSVAEFHKSFKETLKVVGANIHFHGAPNEIPNPMPFAKDGAERPYDGKAVARFHQALVSIDGVFNKFRTGFLGKSSPSHLFWGSFDLAVTRFSGRAAPLHPGGVPALPDSVTQEAYSHEVSSAGFWPGGGAAEDASFYAYAYPGPDGFGSTSISPSDAYWSEEYGEFLLPYEAVCNASDPEGVLMSFLQSSYNAAADLGGWNRKVLDTQIGKELHPRRLSVG